MSDQDDARQRSHTSMQIKRMHDIRCTYTGSELLGDRASLIARPYWRIAKAALLPPVVWFGKFELNAVS